MAKGSLSNAGNKGETDALAGQKLRVCAACGAFLSITDNEQVR